MGKFEIIDKFYNECLDFWKRELKTLGFDEKYISYKAEQHAIQDIVNIKSWSFAGIEVTGRDIFNWYELTKSIAEK